MKHLYSPSWLDSFPLACEVCEELIESQQPLRLVPGQHGAPDAVIHLSCWIPEMEEVLS